MPNNPPSDGMPWERKQFNLTQLRKIVTSYFNEEELRDLCFRLYVDYDSLPGEGRAGKARPLP